MLKSEVSDAADAGEGMGIAAAFFVVDSLGGEAVDAHLSRGVDDAAVAEVYAHMDDVAFGVGEEAEVVVTGFVEALHFGALRGLLRGVAREPFAAGFEAHLSEA